MPEKAATPDKSFSGGKDRIKGYRGSKSIRKSRKCGNGNHEFSNINETQKVVSFKLKARKIKGSKKMSEEAISD